MNSEFNTTYENMGASSYLRIDFPEDTCIVDYEVGMIVSNDIKNLLKASKQVINGKTALYYNISSKVKLSQLIGHKQLKRNELISLIKGAVKALNEAEEYQLPKENIVMDPELIYVIPSSVEPYFIYLPIDGSGGKDLKELILELIMGNKIEMSSDNFIQVLLEALNSDPFSEDRLLSCINRYAVPDKNAQGSETHTIGKGPEIESIESMIPRQTISESVKGETVEGPQQKELKPQRELPMGKKKKVKPEKNRKTNTDDKAESAEGFDKEKARKKFLLPQAFIMVMAAAMISFGAFTDAAGNIIINNVLGMVFVLLLIEVVIYREAFVNTKQSKSEKHKDKGERKKNKKDKAELMTSQRKKPPVPLKEGLQTKTEGNISTKEDELSYHKKIGRDTKPDDENGHGRDIAVRYNIPDELLANETFNAKNTTDDSEITEETMLWEGAFEDSAYLEIFVNGTVERIPLDKESTLIGRLGNKVDYTVQNPKIGKIHAEFINRNGRIYVVDQNSKNGTYINRSSQRINSNTPYPLKDKDLISLADTEFTLRCTDL